VNRFLTGLQLTGLLLLACFSARLAATRIYQVDECQNVYMAAVLASHQQATFYTDASAFNLPLSWLISPTSTSSGIFASARLAMLGLFWLNIILLALNTGQRLFSRWGLLALFTAATLAPLWDYGLEIRHDNALLTGLLLSWYVLRVRPAGIRSYLIAGAVAAVLQLAVFKAFAYTVPLTLIFLFWPPKVHKQRRGRLALAWAAGALGVLLAARLAYGAMGIWETYLADLRGYTAASIHTGRFLPFETLSRLPGQTPLLLCLLTAAMVRLVRDLRRRGGAAFTWDSSLPEGALSLGAFGSFCLNPTPYPYNLVNLVPFAFLFAFSHAQALVTDIERRRPSLIPIAGAFFIFTHIAPFCIATRRHLDWTNERQRQLMSLAESLTDPAKDPVYDAVGMVPTRPSIGFHWYIQSLNKSNFRDGTWPPVRAMLADNPAAVIIPNYRTDWLPHEDLEYIRQRYFALSDDFLVLGQMLWGRGGQFQIIRAGRYRLFAPNGSDVAGTLDGKPFSGGVVKLSSGRHRFETALPRNPMVVWVGPKLDRIGPLELANHKRLFFNWY